MSPVLLDLRGLDDLLAALWARGFTVVGPRERSGAIVFDEVAGVGGPARGRDRRDGRRPLPPHRSGDEAPVPPRRRARVAEALPVPAARAHVARDAATATAASRSRPREPAPRYAFLGVRACDLRAVEIQDRVFLGRPLRRARLRGAAARRVLRRRQLHARGRHVLLRVDGQRAAGARRATTWR